MDRFHFTDRHRQLCCTFSSRGVANEACFREGFPLSSAGGRARNKKGPGACVGVRVCRCLAIFLFSSPGSVGKAMAIITFPHFSLLFFLATKGCLKCVGFIGGFTFPPKNKYIYVSYMYRALNIYIYPRACF